MDNTKLKSTMQKLNSVKIWLGSIILMAILLRFKFSWNKEISPILYFTVQSNLLCALYWIMSPYIKIQIKPYISLAVTMYMTITGLVFSLLINGTFMDKLYVLFEQLKIDETIYFLSIFNSGITHYIMPLLILIDFILLTDCSKIKLKYAKLLSLYPLVYFLFHIIYSVVTSKYIYPFLDPNYMGGWVVIIILVAVSSIAFWGLGKLIAKANRYVTKKMIL